MRFVGTEIIEHDNVSGSECRDKDLPDIELEQFAVDWAVDDPRCVDAIMAQGGEEGHGLPMTIRNHRSQSLAARPQPLSGAMLVFTQVSSMKTRRLRSIRS